MPINDSQGSYESRPAAGYAGMIASQLSATILTGFNEDETLAAGVAVGQGNADRGLTAGGDTFRGVCVAGRAIQAQTFTSGDVVSYLNEGKIFVVAKNDVTASDAVTYDATGAIGAGLTHTITGASFMTAATAGSLVVVQLS